MGKIPSRNWFISQAKKMTKEKLLSQHVALDMLAKEHAFHDWTHASRFYRFQENLKSAFPDFPNSPSALLPKLAYLHAWNEVIRDKIKSFGEVLYAPLDAKISMAREIAEYRADHDRMLRQIGVLRYKHVETLRARLTIISASNTPGFESLEAQIAKDEEYRAYRAATEKAEKEKTRPVTPPLARIVGSPVTEDVEYMSIGHMKVRMPNKKS